MSNAAVGRAGGIASVRVPGDKSISHRALMLTSIAEGTSHIRGLAPGLDVQATLAAMRALGAEVDSTSAAGVVVVSGREHLTSPGEVIHCHNSGTTARLLTGLLAGQPLTARLDGDASLRRRPMDRVVEPLRQAGAMLSELGEPARLPIEVTGAPLRALEHQTPVPSAQVKSALIFAGLSAGVNVRVREPARSRDHTERLARAMGAAVHIEELDGGVQVLVEPPSALRSLEIDVPGDFSSAANWIALGLLGGAGPALRITGIGLNASRTGFLSQVESMGARISVEAERDAGGERMADIVVEPSELRGCDVYAEQLHSLIDEIPILACLAAAARVPFRFAGGHELRVKESDRISALSRNLAALGAEVEEWEDGLSVRRAPTELAGVVDARGDHRIAMAFGVLGALPGHSIEIADPACVDVSYPGFWTTLAALARPDR